jgi:hypothetical protein
MLRTLLPFTILLALPLAAADIVSHVETRDFGGGTLRIRVRTGGLRIVQGSDNQHVTVRYTATKNGLDASSRVTLGFESKGSDASVNLQARAGVKLETVIEVPSPVTLEVAMRDGDILVEGVEGSKTLKARSGDIAVSEPKAEYAQTYKQIAVSARIGSIYGPSFQAIHGKLGQTAQLSGTGAYSLRAHVLFGDIQLLPPL